MSSSTLFGESNFALKLIFLPIVTFFSWIAFLEEVDNLSSSDTIIVFLMLIFTTFVMVILVLDELQVLSLSDEEE